MLRMLPGVMNPQPLRRVEPPYECKRLIGYEPVTGEPICCGQPATVGPVLMVWAREIAFPLRTAENAMLVELGLPHCYEHAESVLIEHLMSDELRESMEQAARSFRVAPPDVKPKRIRLCWKKLPTLRNGR